VKALSVRAPWWWAILHGKPVENRDWYTSYRGPICLHASKWWNLAEVQEDYADVAEMAKSDGFDWPDPCFAALHEAGGCIVGSVTVVDCVTVHPSAFFVGKYGFVLRDPLFLDKPIPFKGALGFFDVPDDLIPAGIRGDKK